MQLFAAAGVTPRGTDGPAFREACREAGLGSPGDPEYTRLAIKVVNDAQNTLSEEDKYLVSGGREGRDPGPP
jgi:hypothetical protein